MASAYFQQLMAVIAAGAGGGLAKRGANTLNILAPASYQNGDVKTEHMVRMYFCLGSCDWDSLQISVYNWIFGQYGIAFSGGTDFEIVEMAIEIGSNWTAVTWGGNQNLVVTNGVSDVLSDPISPSSLGVSGGKFLRDTTGYLRYKIRANASSKFPASAGYNIAGTTKRRYTIGSATVTNGIYSVGDFVLSGTFDTSFTTYNPVIVGTPSTSGKFLGGVGDSIAKGTNDNLFSSTAIGGFSRCAIGSGGTNKLACLNFGVPGHSIINWLGDGTNTPANMSANAANIGKAEAYLKYANILFEQFGSNGTYSTGSGVYAHQDKMWAVLKRGSPGCKLVRTSLFPRTLEGAPGSSDQWATLANQVVTQTPGGDTDLFEQYCASKVGAGVDYYINYNSPRANTNRANADYFKWVVNGSANYATSDGVHPSGAIYNLFYGGEARALIDTITP